MKLLLSVCLLAVGVSAFALPIQSDVAISGLQKTAAFEKAAKSAKAALQYYDKLELTAGPEGGEAERVCFPNGLKSRSGTVVKAVFTNTRDALKVTKYFATPEKAEDFGACN